MMKRFLCLAGMCTVFLSSAIARATDEAAPPALVIRLAPVSQVRAAVRYLAGVTGHENQARKWEAKIREVAPNGLSGIDEDRPLAILGRLDETIYGSSAVIAVPVQNEK